MPSDRLSVTAAAEEALDPRTHRARLLNGRLVMVSLSLAMPDASLPGAESTAQLPAAGSVLHGAANLCVVSIESEMQSAVYRSQKSLYWLHANAIICPRSWSRSLAVSRYNTLSSNNCFEI